jgi:hypothetical protein
MSKTDQALERVRRICLAFPGTNERLSHGMPTFFVRDRKSFAIVADNHHDDGRFALWCHAPEGVQSMLLEGNPEQFFVPPYVGYRGWIGVRLDRDPDWDVIADILEDAYRMVAPKRLLAEIDARIAAGSGEPR